MTRTNKLLVVLVLLIVVYLAGYIKGCKKHDEPRNSVSLPGGTTIISGGAKLKSGPVFYTPPEGKTIITPKDPNKRLEDVVNIHQQSFGTTFEPGIQTAFFAEPNVGLDAKFLYFNRFGANLGFIAGPNLALYASPTLTLSYRLDRLGYVRNTELWIGYVPLTRIQYQLGLRINL